MEQPQWQEGENLSAMPAGAVQPFYHVMIDSRDRRHPSKLPAVAYIAQECLSAPEVPSSPVPRLAFLQGLESDGC